MPPKSKESKAETAPSTYELGDTVLGKIRGYPPWPGQVVDPENVPKTVTKERPQGKKAKFYCVRFLPTGEYGWIMPKDMSRLQKHEIEAYIAEPFRKSGDLLKGYKAALDPSACWESLEAGAQEAEDAEVDQLESDAEESAKPKAKKRKRETEAAEKPAKASRAKKEPAEKKKAVVRSKPGKSKETVESEDEAADEKPATKKAKKDEVDASSETVKGWRHKLQKSFLSKDKPINADEMPDMDKTFTQIEKYDMTLDNLSYSKIGKVMRHIAKLDSTIPSEEEFHFRDRAQKLVDKWGKLAGTTAKSANGSAKEAAEEAEELNGGDVGDLTMIDGDGKADATMDIDAKADADADGEADADAEADPTKDAAGESAAETDGDAKMADA